MIIYFSVIVKVDLNLTIGFIKIYHTDGKLEETKLLFQKEDINKIKFTH